MVDMKRTTQPAFHSTSTRPSSRRALTAALELAQEAVRLDSTNDDPIGAIRAYSRSVALLNEVMERVMHEEEDSGRGRHLGRPRSMAAREEEVRRLKSIHDTYSDRMIILSDIYNIDPYHLTTTDSPVPTVGSTTAEFHQNNTQDNNEDIHSGADGPTRRIMSASSKNLIVTLGSPITESDQPSITDSSLPDFEMVHTPSTLNNSVNSYNLPNPSRHSSILSRTSALPPSLPPPSGPLPGRPRNGSLTTLPLQLPLSKVAPPPVPVSRSSSISTSSDIADIRQSLVVPSSSRPRGNSSADQRAGSDNKLEALDEEGPDNELATKAEAQPSSPVHQSYDHSVSQGASSGEETPVSTSSNSIDSSPPLPSKDIYVLPGLPVSLVTSYTTSNIPSPPLSPATPRVGSIIQSSQTTQSQQSSPTVLRSRGASAPTPRTDSHNQQYPSIINATTSAGTISQRRSKTSTGTISSQPSSRSSTPAAQSSSTSPSPSSQTTPTVRLSGPPVPPLPSENSGGRHRSSSQPPRPGTNSISVSISNVNPRPSGTQTLNLNVQLPRKPSFPSRLSSIQASALTAPIHPAPLQTTAYSAYMPSSPLPLPPPMDSILKPYHLMALLWTTMTSKSGGYITRRLHVPNEVWSQGGVKLSNLPEKVKVVEVLSSALEEVQMASLDFASNNNILLASKCTPDDAERWLNKLDDWNAVCDSIVTSFGRKLGVNEGFVVKKSGGVPFWKVVRSMTNGKSLDSPAAYVSGLVRLFHLAQILGEHTKALLLIQMPPLYTSIPAELCRALELRLRRSSEFLASVVLTFVVKDLSLLLDKYVKKGEKWLTE